MQEKLTDKTYWADYWSSFKPEAVRSDILFADILMRLPDKQLTSLEIGGFPGQFSIFLRKYKNYVPTMLDFHVDNAIMRKNLEVNELKENDLEIIEDDFFTANADKQFDVVMSFGFIEHFSDTAAVIERHLHFLKPGGTLLITLPNLRGLLGSITKKYDRAAYDTHNVASMKIPMLKSIMQNLAVKGFNVSYYGAPYLYINPAANANENDRKRVNRLSSVLCRVLPKLNLHKNSYFSPNIVITATK